MPAGFQPAPPISQGADLATLHRWAERAREVLNGALGGKLNVTGQIELSTGATTTLPDPRLSVQSALILDPMTASAAGLAWHATAEDRANGAWTLRHPAGPAGRVFRYAILG